MNNKLRDISPPVSPSSPLVSGNRAGRDDAATRDAAAALDAADPLASLRDQFVLPEGVVYLDGNSLGALPKRAAARVQATIEHEWGEGLIRSWNTAGWIELSRRIGDKIAALIGARAGEVSVGDSTSVNLFKALSAAVAMQRIDLPKRKIILSERGNFPTDLYMAESVAAANGMRLVVVDGARVAEHLDGDVAVLMLTHVNYRSGRMHRMAETTRAARDAGALAIWDLAHSAGAVPVDLHGADADFAVGCGYKYLNGGPGAPAFVWAHPRHTARMDREQLRQPLSGWLGHAAPFEFAPSYRPARGIERFVCGTPPVLAMAALECGVDVFADAASLGGMAALRAKSIALAELFIDRVEARCAALGLALASSSGFQSWQYRSIEFMLGNKNAAMLKPHAHRPDLLAKVRALHDAPSLYDESLRLLARRGLPVPRDYVERDWSQPYVASEAVEAAWLVVYRDPEAHWDLYQLGEELTDLEDTFRLWRFRHVTTVERVIGFKRGTGGTGGVSYLRKMLDVVLFPEIWKLRTDL